jgi:hypothetical protein
MSLIGCFGMVIAHRTNPTCQECPHMDSCREKALDTAKQIHEVMDVSDLLKHFADIDHAEHGTGGDVNRESARNSQRVTPTDDQERQINTMSKKAQTIARTLIANGIDAKRQILSGVNPFVETGQRYLEVACSMLMQGGFTKKELKHALLSRHGHWTERTAEGQLSVAFSLLNGMGLVTQKGGKFAIMEVCNAK